jgi:ABC-2 type transport system permease protein
MRKFFTLFFVELKLQLGLQTLKEGFKSGPKGIMKSLGYLLIAALLVGSLGFLYLLLLNLVFEPAYMAGLSDTLLTVVVLMAMVLTFVFGIMQCIGLYYNRDTDFLFSLPIPQRTAFAGKFAPIMVSEAVLNVAIILPALIIYSQYARVDMLFWLKGVVVMLLSAAIPLALASIISALIMGMTIFVKHKDKIVMGLGVVFFVLYFLGVQYLSAGMSTMDENALAAILTGGLMETITRAFPPALWAAESLVYTGSSGMNAFLLFTGLSVGALLLSTFVAGSSFIRTSTNQGEAAKSEKRVDLDKSSRSRSVFRALLAREWKTVLRSPVYAMNSLIMALVGPVMVFSIFLMPRGDMGDLNSMVSMMGIPPEVMGYIMLGVAALMYLLGTMNTGAATVFTREGKAVWLLKTLPIEPKRIVLAKLVFGLEISVIVILPLAIALYFMTPFLSIPQLLLSTLCALVATTPVVAGGVFLDMQKPSLNWTSETAAIKRSRNAILEMLLAFLYVAPNVGIVYLLMKLDLRMTAVWAALLVVNAAVSVGIVVGMIKCAPRMISNMGEK